MKSPFVASIAVFSLCFTSELSAETVVFDCVGETGSDFRNVRELRTEYGRRSIAFLNAALAEDLEELNDVVLPDARFEIWDADHVYFSRVSGPDAASDFARELNSTNFEMLVPFAIVNSDACGLHTVELHLTRGADPEAFLVRFSYSDGKLATAIASRSSLIRGAIGEQNGVSRAAETAQ